MRAEDIVYFAAALAVAWIGIVVLALLHARLLARHRRCRAALERARKERDAFRRASLQTLCEPGPELISAYRSSGLL